MVGNLQPGIFYEDSQKVYYLETNIDSVKEENTYHLKVSVPDKGLNFDAETDLIKGSWLNFKFQTILYLAGSGFKVADVDLATTEDGYLEQTLRWTTADATIGSTRTGLTDGGVQTDGDDSYIIFTAGTGNITFSS